MRIEAKEGGVRFGSQAHLASGNHMIFNSKIMFSFSTYDWANDSGAKFGSHAHSSFKNTQFSIPK